MCHWYIPSSTWFKDLSHELGYDGIRLGKANSVEPRYSRNSHRNLHLEIGVGEEKSARIPTHRFCTTKTVHIELCLRHYSDFVDSKYAIKLEGLEFLDDDLSPKVED